MQKIALEAVRRWTVFEEYHVPQVIRQRCSHCPERTSFDCSSWAKAGDHSCLVGVMACNACGHHAKVFVMDPHDKEAAYAGAGEIHCTMVLSSKDDPKEYPNAPAPVQRAYHDGVDCLNSGLYSPGSASFRRLLEGICRMPSKSSDSVRHLAAQIEHLAELDEFRQPLKNLAHSLRFAGSLGPHFDSDGEPTGEACGLIRQLSEHLLDYFYRIPALSAALLELGKKEAEEVRTPIRA
ncbi:DUF4145 domain-containing protein [Luteolibacter sp. LG18]|uniref:DUF4145 domain-containing protein n=1 Tax=Luteolibacter sp. LG18 TaxID=2819286 RepID=UPI002B2E36D7|nr:hypothetical protein llg_30540 [Luteolibacter sp. LG18]